MEKVTKSVIKQLLDDILQDGIINDMEMESIIETNVSRDDKARELIDTVKRKGDRASRKLTAHIQRRDPVLFEELGLSCDQPAPPGELRVQSGSSVHLNRIQHFVFFKAAEPQMNQHPSIDAFWREKQNDRTNVNEF